LDEELAKHKGNEDEIKKFEKQHKKGTEELKVLLSKTHLTKAFEKANAEVSKELAKFDREDVQLQEKKKHKVAKQKKLQKTIQSVFHLISKLTNRVTILFLKQVHGSQITQRKSRNTRLN
jgi:structural maintenance of chromosome 4